MGDVGESYTKTHATPIRKPKLPLLCASDSAIPVGPINPAVCQCQDRFQTGIAVSKLEGQGRENGPEIVPVVEILQTGKAWAFHSWSSSLQRLGQSRLSNCGETVKPEYAFVLFDIRYSTLNQHSSWKRTSPLVSPIASLSVPTQVSHVGGMGRAVRVWKG